MFKSVGEHHAIAHTLNRVSVVRNSSTPLRATHEYPTWGNDTIYLWRTRQQSMVLTETHTKCVPEANALAPGFFLTELNRSLLTDEQGAWTARGQTIVSHTPMGRLGRSADLVGTLLWLVSPTSAFVTGVVIPVDGGFSAYSGV